MRSARQEYGPDLAALLLLQCPHYDRDLMPSSTGNCMVLKCCCCGDTRIVGRSSQTADANIPSNSLNAPSYAWKPPGKNQVGRYRPRRKKYQPGKV